MTAEHTPPQNVMEPPFFSNWADLFMPKIAYAVLPYAIRFPWLTPNVITLVSFLLYVLGCFMIFADIPGHRYYVAFLLPLAYIGDCLDGQVARARVLSSRIGNYLDKTLDVLKIYILCMSLAYGAYSNTDDITYIFLGFTACFFFNFRYYIKLETIFSECNQGSDYLVACRARRQELYREKEKEYKRYAASFRGKMKLFWIKHRTILWVDEAEFVIFTSVAALLNKFEAVLWIFAVSQGLIAFWRLFERGRQVHTQSLKLLDPMRK
jgi:phosphatidylglycerophosphate synthase